MFSFFFFLDLPYAWQCCLQFPATHIMEEMAFFHNFLNYHIIYIGVAIIYLLLIIIIFFNIRRNQKVLHFTHSSLLEIIWTFIPAIILLILAIPSFELLYSLEEFNDPICTLKVIGHQWYWSYEFAGILTKNNKDLHNGIIHSIIEESIDFIQKLSIKSFIDIKPIESEKSETIINQESEIVINKAELNLELESPELDPVIVEVEVFDNIFETQMRQKVLAERENFATYESDFLDIKMEKYYHLDQCGSRFANCLANMHNLAVSMFCVQKEIENKLIVLKAKFNDPVLAIVNQEASSEVSVELNQEASTSSSDETSSDETSDKTSSSDETSSDETSDDEASKPSRDETLFDKTFEELTLEQQIQKLESNLEMSLFLQSYVKKMLFLLNENNENFHKNYDTELGEACTLTRSELIATIKNFPEFSNLKFYLYKENELQKIANYLLFKKAYVGKFEEFANLIDRIAFIDVKACFSCCEYMVLTNALFKLSDKDFKEFLNKDDYELKLISESLVDQIVKKKATNFLKNYYSNYYLNDPVFSGYSFDSYLIPEESLNANEGHVRLLSTDNIVILPSNVEIKVLITSADVLHSWAIPSFGVKVDACPGRLSQIPLIVKREGTFYGQCSEICGVNHGFMPITVKVPMRNYSVF